MQLLYSHSVCVGLFISILIHKGFFSCVVWVCSLCLWNHIDLLLIFAVSNICRTGDTCLPFPRKSWQLSLIFSCRWFRSSTQPPMPWWTTWMFTLSQERPLTSTSNHTCKEQRLLELWSLFLFYLIFVFVCVCFCRCFGCFTMDVIASVAFATQVDSQNNVDDTFVRHAQMFFSFSFFRPIMLFFSQSNSFVLLFKCMNYDIWDIYIGHL